MKKSFLVLAAILGAAFISCQKESNFEQSEPELTGKTYTLTMEATKAADTKGLVDDGTHVVTSWAATDEVKVCKHGSATPIGTLTPSVAGSATASLSGIITLTDVNIGDKLDLIFPDTSWTYENQDGTIETIATSYDFARAEVTVNDINGSTLVASDATFTNEQSLVKFSLFDKDDNSLLDVNYLKISAASGKLVKSYEVSGDAYTPVYGDLVITPTSGPASAFYVALRNTSGAPDTYTLTAHWGTSTYYTFVKSGVTFANGHYRAINVKMHKETVVYTVAGMSASNNLFGTTDWDTTNSDNDMVKQADGTYRKTYQLDGTEVAIKFKVVENHSWSNSWGGSGSHIDGDGNYFIDTGEITKGTLVITFDPSSGTVNAYIQSDAFTVAGDDQDIFGTQWNAQETANDMVKQMDDTFLKDYTITSGLVGRTIKFKVAQDHDWTNSWGGTADAEGNYQFTIPHTGILHISFDPTTHRVDAWMDNYRYTLAGYFNGWDITANPMTKQNDGTFKCEVSLPAGTGYIEYKVVHAEVDWIGDPNNSNNNYSLDLGLGSTVLYFTYNPATNTVSVQEQQVTLYIKSETAIKNELCFKSDELHTASWPGTGLSAYSIVAGSRFYSIEFGKSFVSGQTITDLYVVDRDTWQTLESSLTFPADKSEYFIIATKGAELELLANRPAEPSISIDGSFSDWAGVSGNTNSPSSTGNVSTLKAYSDGTNLFVYHKMTPGASVTFDLAGWRYFRMYFDTDNDATTGWDTSHWLYAGADLVANGSESNHDILVYHCKGGIANACIEDVVGAYSIKTVSNADGSIEVELQMSLSDLGTISGDEIKLYTVASVASDQASYGILGGIMIPTVTP